MANPKIFIFDLETSELAANRGHILCAAGKWLGSDEVYTWNIYDNGNYGEAPQHKTMRDDGFIAEEIRDLCAEADAVCAYYGGYGKFDVPYLNTRLLAHQKKPCPPLTVIDPYTTAKKQLRLQRNNMDSVAAVLGCDAAKYHLPWADWLHARYYAPKAMNKLLDYCVNDVLVLEELYLKLRPLITNHPYVAPFDENIEPREQCPACGSGRTQSRGTRRTKLYSVHRRSCTECGTFFESHREKVK